MIEMATNFKDTWKWSGNVKIVKPFGKYLIKFFTLLRLLHLFTLHKIHTTLVRMRTLVLQLLANIIHHIIPKFILYYLVVTNRLHNCIKIDQKIAKKRLFLTKRTVIFVKQSNDLLRSHPNPTQIIQIVQQRQIFINSTQLSSLTFNLFRQLLPKRMNIFGWAWTAMTVTNQLWIWIPELKVVFLLKK